MSASTAMLRPRRSRRDSTAHQSVRPMTCLSLIYSFKARNSHPGGGIPGQLYSAKDNGPDVGSALFDRLAAGFELGVKDVPDMDHLRPDLQIHTDIRRTGDFGQPDRIVKQGFRRADLDQQWRQPGESGL